MQNYSTYRAEIERYVNQFNFLYISKVDSIIRI